MATKKPAKKLTVKLDAIKELEILRPERAKLSAEEALKRMQAFAEERKEQFIATSSGLRK